MGGGGPFGIVGEDGTRGAGLQGVEPRLHHHLPRAIDPIRGATDLHGRGGGGGIWMNPVAERRNDGGRKGAGGEPHDYRRHGFHWRNSPNSALTLLPVPLGGSVTVTYGKPAEWLESVWLQTTFTGGARVQTPVAVVSRVAPQSDPS
jgi:hypothetical protein